MWTTAGTQGRHKNTRTHVHTLLKHSKHSTETDRDDRQLSVKVLLHSTGSPHVPFDSLSIESFLK
jgi:hypothetical protein